MLDITKIICPFCNKETINTTNCCITGFWNKCENHGNINVNIHREGYVEIFNSNYLFFFNKKNISLYKILTKNKVEKIIEFLHNQMVISDNQIITPENFEQKLKTYLLFL